jgi:uncharacterized membrane protein (Fun14 family)
MATKEAVFSLRVDTGNSVQDIQNADQAVKNFNKDLKETQATASSGTGMDAFQQNLDELNARVSAGGLTMRDMTKAMKEYQSIAAQAGVESPVGQEAIRAAAQMKDTIGDLKGATTALSSDFVKLDTAVQGIETGAAVFQGLQSAVALTGIENENLQKTMVKLQATQGIVNAVNTVAKNLNKDAILGIQLRTAAEKLRNFVMTGSVATTRAQAAGEVALGTATVGTTVATQAATNGMKLLRIAMIATGVGALVIGLALLIANFDKVKEAVVGAYDKFNKLGPAVKTVIMIMFPLIGLIVGVTKALEYFGVVDDANTRKLKANAEARTKSIEKEQNKIIAAASKKQKANDAYYDHEINLLKASGKATYEMALLKAKAHLAEGRVMLAAQAAKIKAYKAEIEVLIATGDADSDRVKNLKKSLVTVSKAAGENYNDLVATKNAIEVMQAEHSRELADQSRTAGTNAKQKQDELNKSRLEILKSHLEREIQATEDSENLKISQMAEGEAKQIATLEDTYGDWRTELIKKASEGELKALDDKFAKGKMTEQEYRDELQKIMENGVKNLTTEEVQLMTDKEAQLAEGIRRAKLTAEQRELEDVSSAFQARIALANSQGEQGKAAALQLVVDEEVEKAKVRKKYADLALEESARQEAIRREKTKFINSLIKTDAEIAIQELNFQQIDAKRELLKRLMSDDEKEQISQQEFDAAMIALEKKKIAAIAKINLDATASTKAAAQKEREEELSEVTAGIAQAQAALDQVKIVNDLLNEIGTARINKINEERDEDLASLDAKQQAELSAVGLTADQKTAIEEKFAKQKYDVQLKAFNEEDKINRKKFNRDKAIKLAQVVMDTASAITKGIAEFGPPPSPAGIAAIASAGFIGITQAVAIANQKYQGGTMPTMPSVSSGGGGGSMAGSSSSSFTASTSPTGTSTSGLLGQAATASQPVQVFVLENDISSTQNKVAVQEQKSSF